MRGITWVSLLVAAIAVGSPVAASASHPAQMCLDLREEHTYDTSNDDMFNTLQAYPGATDDRHPTEHEGCVTELVEPGQTWTGVNIDFEIIEDEDGDTPTTPDMACTVGEGSASCWVAPPRMTEGTQAIRGWIDFDSNDATAGEADLSEGVDEEAEPGDLGEPDATDVVLWHWSTMDTTSESTVTIRYARRAGAFRGQVTSEYSLCSVERTVKVFKRRVDGRRLMGSAETNENGVWRVTGVGNPKGRFYAVATETTRHTASPSTDMTCLRARSSTIRVR